jgi:hypothetical protein
MVSSLSKADAAVDPPSYPETKTLMPKKSTSGLVAAATLALACAWIPAQTQTTSTLRIDPSDRRATWDGFGAGLSW